MSSRQGTRRLNRQKQPSGQSSTLPKERQRRVHRSTLTCTNCRVRKTKCDGTQPGCKTCEVYHDNCRYEKPPPMAQIIAMSKRLQEYEHIIETLKGRVSTPITRPADANIHGESASFPHASDTTSDHELDTSKDTSNERSGSRSWEVLSVSTSLLSDLSLDENGKLCYYGPTSAVHDPPNLDAHRVSLNQYNNPIPDTVIRTALVSNALESRAWETFALGNAALDNDIPKDTISKLLQLHWSWIAPMFMWVYRPAFMRDMITGGQYFSQFLLIVLCAHSSRFQASPIGDVLISRVRLMLGTEVQKPSSIPTVQALLQLSARDLAYGSISQAWLYSGMAFRMVSDLGLHHFSGKIVHLGHLTAEDLEIRRRLFWSCYFWDKAISLYLGRMPALTELSFDHEPELFDDYTAHEIWVPYYCDSDNSAPISSDAYPPTESHSVQCFKNSCKLAVIINQIILQLYSRRALSITDSTLRGIRSQLDNWRANSPPYLRYDPDSLSGVCCPPHILTQNLLYFTTIILLHRPFYSSPVHHAACRHASENIEKLLLFFERTFGFTRITYLMAYCVYTGASAIIQDVKAGDAVTTARMGTFLRALKGGCTTCPIVQRSIDIIINGLEVQAPTDDSSNQLSSSSTTDNENIGKGYLPAFPHHNAQGGFMDFGNLEMMDSDAFLLLNSFPETQIGTDSMEWYMPP